MTEEISFAFPEGVLVCPVCMSDIPTSHCNTCNSDFFSLGDIPCVFTTGIQQKYLWQHQMAMIEEQGSAALEQLEYLLEGYDVSAMTRSRLELAQTTMTASFEMIMGQFKSIGLSSQRHEMYEQATVDDPTEYYQHILRDWAWDDEPSRHYDVHVNESNLKRVLDVWPSPAPQKMLLLGAGAGRLSWDLHKALKPKYTIASDINPFLLSCAHALIKERKSINLPELYTYPQIGFPHAKNWVLSPPEDPEAHHKSWFALGSDVWNMPLKESSLDTIVTSWLLDVCGGDVKDLISVISYLIEPGGTWVNSGPLLYSNDISFEKKYTAEEILDFADMAGFDVQQQSVEEIAHMASPLNARYHHEQLFSFCARKRTEEKAPAQPSHTEAWLTPPWLVMHHIAVPAIEFKCQMDHDFIKQVLDLVDGDRSIYLIAQTVQPGLPEGVDAKEAVVALFGQILEQMAEKFA